MRRIMSVLQDNHLDFLLQLWRWSRRCDPSVRFVSLHDGGGSGNYPPATEHGHRLKIFMRCRPSSSMSSGAELIKRIVKRAFVYVQVKKLHTLCKHFELKRSFNNRFVFEREDVIVLSGALLILLIFGNSVSSAQKSDSRGGLILDFLTCSEWKLLIHYRKHSKFLNEL